MKQPPSSLTPAPGPDVPPAAAPAPAAGAWPTAVDPQAVGAQAPGGTVPVAGYGQVQGVGAAAPVAGYGQPVAAGADPGALVAAVPAPGAGAPQAPSSAYPVTTDAADAQGVTSHLAGAPALLAAPVPPVPGAPAPVPVAQAPHGASGAGQIGMVAAIAGVIMAVGGTLLSALVATHLIGWVMLALAFILSVVAAAVSARRRLALVGLVVSLVGAIVAAVVYTVAIAGAEVEVETGTVQANAPGSDSQAAFTAGVYTSQGWTILITGHRVIEPGAQGNEDGPAPLLVIEYTMTNEDSEAEVYPAMFPLVFHVYQDNDPNTLNELEVATDSTLLDRLGDVGDQVLKPGGSVDYEQAYVLSDTTTPVDIVAKRASGDEIGRQRITLP